MMKKNPLISIIVPVYNTEKYLETCLESLVNQSLYELEIICVNDGSLDRSLEVLNKYAQKDGRIQVITQKNGGLSAARNTALDQVKGQYVLFVDSDDWIDTILCEQLYQIATKENADCVMCSYIKEFKNHSTINHIFDKAYISWNEQAIQSQIRRKLFGLVGEELAKPQDGDLIVSACMQLFRSTLLQDLRFVDNKVIGTEDALYQIMFYKKCRKFVYIDQPLYHYRKTNESSITSSYNATLFEKWQNLYDLLARAIEEENLEPSYIEAFYNRVALGMIGLGLNELKAKHKTMNQKATRLKEILNTKRYKNAYEKLEFTYLPFKWKIFFYLCKYQKTMLLVIMLECIEFLRKRVRLP